MIQVYDNNLTPSSRGDRLVAYRQHGDSGLRTQKDWRDPNYPDRRDRLDEQATLAELPEEVAAAFDYDPPLAVEEAAATQTVTSSSPTATTARAVSGLPHDYYGDPARVVIGEPNRPITPR